MRKKILLLLSFLFTGLYTFAQVSIGSNTPAEAAALDLVSTTKGFLPPRLTNAQMNAISSPATGLQVYCTDCALKGLYQYDGVAFVSLNATIAPVLATLNCAGATTTGTLKNGESAFGVTVSIPYTGASGNYDSISIPSTGITGLTATASFGSFTTSNDLLHLVITGTPASGGANASFEISLGGQTCTVSLPVSN